MAVKKNGDMLVVDIIMKLIVNKRSGNYLSCNYATVVVVFLSHDYYFPPSMDDDPDYTRENKTF